MIIGYSRYGYSMIYSMTMVSFGNKLTIRPKINDLNLVYEF